MRSRLTVVPVLEIHRVLKRFMVMASAFVRFRRDREKRLPFVAGDFGIGIKRLPGIWFRRPDLEEADASSGFATFSLSDAEKEISTLLTRPWQMRFITG
ncbi:MAG: hypothetical protein KGS61_02225 [Verrucomicrobia bacterium]|nr:hypothetical protein [Verrucomicrobiota bacterium]